MRLTNAQRNSIRKLERMTTGAGQWVGDPSYLDLLTIYPMGGEPITIEVCHGWNVVEYVINPDGSRRELSERLA